MRRLVVAFWLVVVVTLGVSAARAWASASFFTPLSASLSVPREVAGASPLADGRVLIVGGTNGSGSAELFDPYSGAFTTVADSLRAPREWPAVAPLPDGRVLIAGGLNTNGYLSTAEVFDPTIDRFEYLVSDLTAARYGGVAAPLPDGKVLIAGGRNDSGFLSSAELYDASNDTFTALPAAMTAARWGAVAAPLPDGRVLIAGGRNDSGFLSSAELFDPSADTFTALPARLTVARFGAVAAPLPDGRVLIAGGIDGAATLRSAELFDPATDTFTALQAPLSVVREGAVAALLPDGRVLIAGGTGGGGYLSSAEAFEPAPEASVAGGDFGAQIVGEPSALESLVVSNLGAQALSISGASLGGADASEFSVVADGCAGRRLAFAQSCTLAVLFTPAASGARTATLALDDNEPTPTAVVVQGIGVGPVHGPAGPAGPVGPVGPAGATGPRGPVGAIQLVSCQTITVHVKQRTVHRRRCSTRLISGSVTFTTAIAQATLVRGPVVYGAGTARLGRLTLQARRRILPGRYTLILRRRDGRRWVSARRQITIA